MIKGGNYQTFTSILIYVHLKNDVFSISLPLYQGNTLSLPNVITSLVDFVTSYKLLWRLCVSAGTSDSKNPKLYYYTNGASVPGFPL